MNAPKLVSRSRLRRYGGRASGRPADFCQFLGRLAGEYCGSSVKAIEVWNEQNLHYEWGNRPINPSEYMALLRPSYGAIKAACPSMYVISGALTPAGDNGSLAMDDFRYFEAMLQQGLANYVDGFGAHPSGYNVPPSAVWQSACDAIQQTGNQNFNGACDNPHHSWSFRSTMEATETWRCAMEPEISQSGRPSLVGRRAAPLTPVTVTPTTTTSTSRPAGQSKPSR